jgi:hypothetical protein
MQLDFSPVKKRRAPDASCDVEIQWLSLIRQVSIRENMRAFQNPVQNEEKVELIGCRAFVSDLEGHY